jgi:hypothetical protein
MILCFPTVIINKKTVIGNQTNGAAVTSNVINSGPQRQFRII